MRDIADEAGVSAQTIYDGVGSKRVLVGQLNDLVDTEAGIRELAASIDAAENPRDILVTQAAITRSILEHCGDIVVALVSGSDAEHELLTRRRTTSPSSATGWQLRRRQGLQPDEPSARREKKSSPTRTRMDQRRSGQVGDSSVP